MLKHIFSPYVSDITAVHSHYDRCHLALKILKALLSEWLHISSSFSRSLSLFASGLECVRDKSADFISLKETCDYGHKTFHVCVWSSSSLVSHWGEFVRVREVEMSINLSLAEEIFSFSFILFLFRFHCNFQTPQVATGSWLLNLTLVLMSADEYWSFLCSDAIAFMILWRCNCPYPNRQ